MGRHQSLTWRGLLGTTIRRLNWSFQQAQAAWAGPSRLRSRAVRSRRLSCSSQTWRRSGSARKGGPLLVRWDLFGTKLGGMSGLGLGGRRVWVLGSGDGPWRRRLWESCNICSRIKGCQRIFVQTVSQPSTGRGVRRTR